MSRFDGAFATCGLPGLLYQFGRPVTYSPVNSPEVSLTAIVPPEVQRVDDKSGAVVTTRECKVIITNDPDSDYGGVTTASDSATMTIGGEEWAVDHVRAVTGGWELSLVRPELAEQARPGYRGSYR